MLIMTREQTEAILAHARAGLPNEACGLIAGVAENGEKRVERVYLLRNIDESPEHFSMDPKDQFRAVADMRANGWELFGNFHSHPSTPARPSAEDIRLAFDPRLSYIILSLAGAEPQMKSFLIQGGGVSEEPLKVLENNGENRTETQTSE